jgi:general secretion pathway protein F
MGAFEYTALDAAGKKKKGVLEGDTARLVRQQLRDKGWTPLTVEEVAQKISAQQRKGGFGSGISAADLALLTRQLATLVRSALPLEEALQAAAQQSEKERIKSLLLAVRARVMEGHTFADGLTDFPHVFSELYRATVAAGEQSGHLDTVLERLADYTEIRQAMRQKIMTAMFYPLALVGVAVSVVVFLVTYVVPQVVKVFADSGKDLPLPTQILISTSDFLRDNGLYLLGAIILGLITFNFMMRREGFRYSVHLVLLRMPFIRRLVRGVSAGRFTRTLSILAGSGVPVLEAMRISAQVITNLPMRESVVEAANRVREGSNIYRALEKSGYFPPMTLHLIGSGEAAGKLEEMLERAAQNQEREIEGVISFTMSAMEPLIIVVMGVAVLFIVVSILMPILEMNNLVA